MQSEGGRSGCKCLGDEFDGVLFLLSRQTYSHAQCITHLHQDTLGHALTMASITNFMLTIVSKKRRLSELMTRAVHGAHDRQLYQRHEVKLDEWIVFLLLGYSGLT